MLFRSSEIGDKENKTASPVAAAQDESKKMKKRLWPMKIVMQHYQSYIAHLSMKKIRDESGNTYYGVDEDLRERLQAKLMRAVLSFKTDN